MTYTWLQHNAQIVLDFCKQYHQKRLLQLFSASGLLHFATTDILGLLPKTSHGNQYFLMQTDRYLKLIRVIPTSETSAKHTDYWFLINWTIWLGNRDALLRKNGPNFEDNWFASFCEYHGVKHLTTMTYRLHKNGQAQRINWTIFRRLRYCILDYQLD